VLVYDAKGKNDLGFMNDNVTLYTDEATDDIKSFSVYATIEEYFAPMTDEELAKAPHLQLAKATHDFGKIKPGQNPSIEFEFTNTGQSPLSIRKVKPNCGCTVAKSNNDKIKPGKSGKIKVTFNSQGRKGNQQKSVAIYTNDPVTPVQRVTIKTYVESAEQQ